MQRHDATTDGSRSFSLGLRGTSGGWGDHKLRKLPRDPLPVQEGGETSLSKETLCAS
jgi:hypothetical protein